MATNFQETVAMDLKFCHGKILLHLIDQCTQLSASCTIPNKNPDTVIKAIFKIWISVYGSAEKFLTDNGGDFANSDFIKLCKSFGITVKTTAAESPWSNGLVERHNFVLSDKLDKILHDNNCDFDLVIAWAVNAKNSLSNIHGFSPYQVAIGTNPKLPSLHTAKAPAITTTPTNKIITRNLQALHKAREAFIASENSEKLKRAFSHNIRTSGDTKYLTGDTVYFKRINSNQWHGPAKVLGQDRQQVLIKNGSFYLRVHPYRLQLIDKKPQNNHSIQQNHCTNHPQPLPLHTDQQQPYFSDSDSSDDLSNLHCNQRQMPATVPSSQPSITPLQSSLSAHQATTASSQSFVAPSQSLTSTQTTTTTQPIVIPDTSQQTKKIKPNSLIKYELGSTSDWGTAKIINRTGKATGKYSNCWNISDEYGEQKSIDLSKVEQWKVTKESEVTSRTEEDLLKSLSNLSLNEINDDERDS